MLNQLDSDYRSFFALKRKGDVAVRPPRFKGKKHFTTTVYNPSGFRLGHGFIRLSHKHPSGVPLPFMVG